MADVIAAPVVPAEEKPPTEVVAETIKAVTETTQAPEKPEEVKTEEPHKPMWEQVKDARKPEVATEPKKKDKPVEPKQPSEATRQNFEKLERSWKEAEDRAKKAEEALKKITDDHGALTEKTKQYADVDERIKTLQQQVLDKEENIKTLSAELRGASVERDPEFVKEFVEGRKGIESKIEEILSGIEVPKAAITKFLKHQDAESLQEWRESLPVDQQYELDAALRMRAELDIRKEQKLKNREEAFADIQKRRRAEYDASLENSRKQNLTVARQVEDELFTVDIFKDDNELREQVRETLRKASFGELQPAEIMAQLGKASMLERAAMMQARVIQMRTEELDAKTKENEELTKKVAELEAFVKEASGDTRSGDASHSNGNGTETYVPAWQRVKTAAA